jgi:hypothetical protein
MEAPVSAPEPSPFVNRERALGFMATATLYVVQIRLDMHREPART